MISRIDLQHPHNDALRDACQQSGFFRLVGHDLAPALKQAALTEIQNFFAQSSETKRTISRTADNCWGFYDNELTKNRKDRKEILDIGSDMDQGPLAGARAQWPDTVAFRSVISELNDVMHQVALEITRHVCATLDRTFDPLPYFADHSSFLRLNYYPLSSNPADPDTDWLPEDGELGIHHHTDAGAITVLMHDGTPGLQVRQGDRWQLVHAEQDELIINIGDIVQVWSNDRYRAPLHRVLASTGNERISVPYFLNPDYNYDYAPLAAIAPKYQAINWGEFRSRRSQGDYADHGAEVQISDYRL